MLKIEKYKDEIAKFNLGGGINRCELSEMLKKNICKKANGNCDLCLKISLLELAEEYEEPIKLTRFEYDCLRFAKKTGYNFIARDEDGKLYSYNVKPSKRDDNWKIYHDYDSDSEFINIFSELLSFIKWEDEEPWNVDEILAKAEAVEDAKI